MRGLPTWLPWAVAAGAGLGVLAWVGSASAQEPLPGDGVLDRRAHARLSAKAAKHTRTRPAENVYALVLHQMGFVRRGGPERYDGVTAHYLVLPDGTVVWLHDHTTRLPAAGGLNHGSVSVEFAGNFPSRARSTDPAHFWSPETHGMDQLTEAQIAGGRGLVAMLHQQGWLTHILAHRQGGPERQNDPGPDVWREIGKWAVEKYGLEWGGEGFAVTGGEPIPSHWWGSTAAGAVA